MHDIPVMGDQDDLQPLRFYKFKDRWSFPFRATIKKTTFATACWALQLAKASYSAFSFFALTDSPSACTMVCAMIWIYEVGIGCPT